MHTSQHTHAHANADILLSEHLGVLLRVVPVREGHVLQLDWDIPPTDKLYKQVCVCVCNSVC